MCEHIGDRKLDCKTISKVQLGILPIECEGSEGARNTGTIHGLSVPTLHTYSRIPIHAQAVHFHWCRSLINANILGMRLHYGKHVYAHLP